MGRAKTKGNRSPSGRKKKASTAAERAMAGRTLPADYILARRKLFAFVTPSKGPDGRVGEIDQDICDGIGQLHAVGLLDGHGIDPQEMRDKGRLYGQLYWQQYPDGAPRVGKYEPSIRSDGGSRATGLEPGPASLFERMDCVMTAYDRRCVVDLVIDPAWGDEITPWAHSLICEALLARRIFPPSMIMPTLDDRARLEAAIRGLCAIVDGSLPQRWERAA